MTNQLPHRNQLLADLPAGTGTAVLARGRASAAQYRVEHSAFITHYAVSSEIERKRQNMANRSIALHAQIGYRDPELTRKAWAEVYQQGLDAGQPPERYGICLDWSMGYRRDDRKDRQRGTGLIIADEAAVAQLTAQAPVAAHFGDFVLGFPAAVENTRMALAGGSTTIGNLGQYFTFRLPDWDDDIACTEATIEAIGLISGQPVEMLIHSNLDDGFAAQFTDMSSALGAVLTEKHIIETLCGVPLAHCFGHHFTEAGPRLAFQRAQARLNPTPGSMIYGATMGYRGDDVENYAALAGYLSTDILSQHLLPSGHAINPVPVTENSRIPDISEVIDAQRFAIRLLDSFAGMEKLIDTSAIDRLTDRLVDGARRFHSNLMTGLTSAGYDTSDPFEMLLALRRIGGRRLEELFGAGAPDPAAAHGRRPVAPSPTLTAIERMVDRELEDIDPELLRAIPTMEINAIVASTDVHEHGKHFVEAAWRRVGINTLDGGVSVDADDLARTAMAEGVNVIAISTYNGVASAFARQVADCLPEGPARPLILIGGRLNEIADSSNTSLPRQVEAELEALGVVPCANLSDALLAIDRHLNKTGDIS
mgnify:FL=1